jgi:hypothetical protein
MDAAAMADVAGRMHERLLAGARTGPPPQKRRRPSLQAGAIIEKLSISRVTTDYIAEAAGSRAVGRARQRLVDVEQRADIYRAVGLIDAALRLDAVAEVIRAEVLA